MEVSKMVKIRLGERALQMRDKMPKPRVEENKWLHWILNQLDKLFGRAVRVCSHRSHHAFADWFFCACATIWILHKILKYRWEWKFAGNDGILPLCLFSRSQSWPNIPTLPNIKQRIRPKWALVSAPASFSCLCLALYTTVSRFSVQARCWLTLRGPFP